MKLTETELIGQIENLTTRRLRLLVRRGWIAPAMSERGPLFDQVDLARARLVCQLQADMTLDGEAVPMVLSLIDQLHGLRRELRSLAAAVERQPEMVRREILEAFRAPPDG